MTDTFSNRVRSTPRLVWALIVGGLVLRILFILFGAEAFWPGDGFHNGDSASYLGFWHFLEHGTYTFDASHPDASFGRVPGYPIFAGLQYWLFGETAAPWTIAFSQTLLEGTITWMIYWITRQIGGRQSGLVVAILHATYPFSLVWVSMIGTEILATFIATLVIYLLVCLPLSPRKPVALGVLVGVGLLTREYLVFLGPLCALYLWFEAGSTRDRFLVSAVLAGSFLVAYAPWPVRNVVSHDRLVLLRPETSGYRGFGRDVVYARAWMNTFGTYVDPYLRQIGRPGAEVEVPADALPTPRAREKFDHLVQRARECGSGFVVWGRRDHRPETHCNEEIATGFKELRRDFRDAYPWRYYTDVPVALLRKALFKSQLIGETTSAVSTISTLLFVYRSMLLLLGYLGFILFFFRSDAVRVIGLFAISLTLFWAFVIRFLEMRYLLQADVLMLIPAGLAITEAWRWGLDRIKRSHDVNQKSPAN